MWLKFFKFIFLLLSFAFGFSEPRQVVISNDAATHINNAIVMDKSVLTKEEPVGFIEIPKIHLRKNLYSKNSSLNNVNKNIEILDSSNMPDEDYGNFILAAHSGHSSIAYFHDLHKLNIGDEVKVNYNNHNYVYKVTKVYDVKKTGKIMIKRDKDKKTITMVTCIGSFKQRVVIGYLT